VLLLLLLLLPFVHDRCMLHARAEGNCATQLYCSQHMQNIYGLTVRTQTAQRTEHEMMCFGLKLCNCVLFELAVLLESTAICSCDS
jgi:hypothetical protein